VLDDCRCFELLILYKKSLKIPKGLSESVKTDRQTDRQTDNTMAKRKITKNDIQNTTQKTKV